MRNLIAAICIGTALLAMPAHASNTEPLDDPSVDPAACVSAAAKADDADRIIDLCSKVIAFRDTAKADRLKALIARSAAYARKSDIDRAIADADDALRLDPNQPDLLNSRGELWLAKLDRRKALMDFAAALKLQPDHAAARTNHKALALEVEKLGAQKAVAGKPSFDCRKAHRRLEKTICADPALADLDRDIHALYLRVLQNHAGKPAEQAKLRREHETFMARRAEKFGRRGYDLKAAMTARKLQLTGLDGY